MIRTIAATPASLVALLVGAAWLLTPPASAEVAGQIKVSSNPAWFSRTDGSPFFMCGAGDPEEFLHNWNQDSMIDKMARSGANAIYMIAVRSHGGDGGGSENPFVGGHPGSGLDQNKLNRWDQWFAKMDQAGIVIYFFFYDDSSCPWGDCRGGVGSQEKAFIEGLVNKFERHKNIIWVVAEEYSEKLSKSHASEMARIIKQADDHDHPVGVHQLSGLDFDFGDDPNIDHFAIQYNDAGVNADDVHRAMVSAWNKARRRYNITMSEAAGGAWGKGDEARRAAWAAAMGGAYVTVHGWHVDDTPEARLEECGYMVDFFEKTRLLGMEPNDGLKSGATNYVMADPGQGSYVAYSRNASGPMGVKGLDPGTYTFRWLDTVSGATRDEVRTIAATEEAWAKPSGFGNEVALSIERGGSNRRSTSPRHLPRE